MSMQDTIRALEIQRDAALRVADAKDNFITNLSHEIRTSLNGMMGVLSLLQRSELIGEKKLYVDTAVKSAVSLLHIVDEILDFSKIAQGKIQFDDEVFDLREVVEECMELYKNSAHAKNVALHCFIPLDVPSHVCGDAVRLRQIITNLLSNALKFTTSGDISLRVTLLGEGVDAHSLRFTVEDSGIGIAAEKLEHIFEPFSQEDEETFKKYGGTGLGLSVCKKLIEMQSGEIGVKSRLDHGTLFWFTLTYRRTENHVEFAALHRVEKKKIVLFDNCETCSTIFNQYLPQCTIVNRTAGSVEEVLFQLRKLKTDELQPDIICVDYSAAENDIDSLTNGIGELFQVNRPLIFVILRKSGMETQLEKSGVAGTMYKPLRLSQILGVIGAGIAGEAEVNAKVERKMEPLEGKVLLVDDELINQHVGEMILSKLGLEVEIAGSGEEALAMTLETHYDLVLMDVQMPEMSGIDATRTLRSREAGKKEKQLVIVAVTANALASMKESCIEAGMNGFILKPIQPDLLVEHLSPWLARKESEPEPKVVFSSTDESKDRNIIDGQGAWDRSLALQYLGGDEDLLHDLMKLFITRKNKLLSALEESLKTTDGEAISCAAHAFKGAVNHFAAKRCQNLALTIERKAGEGWLDGLETYLAELKTAADVLEEELRQQVVG